MRLAGILGLVWALSLSLLAYQSGPAPAMTGGFGEETCHSCHFDNPLNAPGGTLVLSDVPAAYTPGEPYTLSVALSREGFRRAGFELSARLAEGPNEGRQAGTLEPVDDRVQIVSTPNSGVQYAQHTEAGSHPQKTGSAAWRVRWIAPPEASGPIVFHLAGNAGDDDESPLGDFIYLTSAVVEPQKAGRLLELEEHVDVARLLLDVRVLDDRGAPVRDLTPADFAVEIDGTPGRVESVQWVEANATTPEPPPIPLAASDAEAVPPPGRLITFLFQKDLAGSRTPGLMSLLQKSHQLVGELTPADRVAVLAFDTHLRLWLDFTNDFERVRQVLERSLLMRQPGSPRRTWSPSLLDAIDAERARQAGSLAESLALIGRALAPMPGSKSLVLVGYGFGTFSRDGVMLPADYTDAVAALLDARASVFCLDVTDADAHSLDAGLQIVAEHTGGFFERTHDFSARALNRLQGALDGYYVLFVEALPTHGAASPRISVDLTSRKGTVLAKTVGLRPR